LAIVWPCHLSVDQYAALGRDVEVPRPDCPVCLAPMTRWSGYRRKIRHDDEDVLIFVARARCSPCGATHAQVPAFALTNRLHDAETIGALLEEVLDGPAGVRPAAEARAIGHETARGWVRRFRARALELAASFAALAVEIGAEPVVPASDPARYALDAMRSAFAAAAGLPGWASLGLWRFCSAVSGGRLLATNTMFPYLVVGKRRFMPPVPNDGERNRGRDGP
jgi:transposase-like protein